MSASSRKTRSLNPLFNTMFSYVSPTEQSEDSARQDTVKKWNYYDVDILVSPVEFYFQAIGSVENLKFNLGYSAELFKKETIERFIEYFNEVLDAVIGDDEIKLGDIRITHQLFDREVSIPETNFDFGLFEN